MSANILLVDDDQDVLSALKMLLQAEGYAVVRAESPKDALAALSRQDFSLILMDLNYTLDTTSGEEGLQLISAIRKQDEYIPIVVMTGWGSIEVAVNSMQQGASDFVQKPWENERLIAIVQNQLKLCGTQKQALKLDRQNQILRQQLGHNAELIAESASMQQVLSMLQQVADTDASILLTGENGTGKSLLARWVHQHSERSHAPLVSVNMGAVSESLFESEMFGHVKGAFTDAKSSRIGRFELADTGTLFLDEIANTAYAHQAKLLRVLEEHQFERVGSSKTQQVDVRIISATNANLAESVEQGRFRKDLLYRLNAIEIEIPPLRNRPEDIIPLAESFLEKLAVKYSQPPSLLSESARIALLNYPWPGNVRELQHVMHRAQVLSKHSEIKSSQLGLPAAAKSAGGVQASLQAGNQLETLASLESKIIDQRLAHFDGNALKAAESLGLSKSAFYRRLEKQEAHE